MSETLTMAGFNGTFLTSTEDTQFNYTTVNVQAVLDEANRRYSSALIPCMIYIGVLMFVGIVGNSLVCYVFGFRFKPCAQNFFILFLAIFDLLSCGIALSGEIADLALHFKFHSAVHCKIMRFINTFTAVTSILTLILIAVDRFRRIRKPLKSQITSRHARLSIIPIFLVSFILSSPATYVYGLRTVETGTPGVMGLDCTISDQAKHNIIPLVYNGLFFFLFIFLATCLVVMYTLILKSLKEHARTLRKASIGTLSTGNEYLVESNDDAASLSPSEDVKEPRNQSTMEEFHNLSSNSDRTTLDTTEGNGEVDKCRSHQTWTNTSTAASLDDQQITSQSESVSSDNLKDKIQSSIPRAGGDLNDTTVKSPKGKKGEHCIPNDEMINNEQTTHTGSESLLGLEDRDSMNDCRGIINIAMESEENEHISENSGSHNKHALAMNITNSSNTSDDPGSEHQNCSKEDSTKGITSLESGSVDGVATTSRDKLQCDGLCENKNKCDNGTVGDNGTVCDNGTACDIGTVCDNGRICENAKICRSGKICENGRSKKNSVNREETNTHHVSFKVRCTTRDSAEHVNLESMPRTLANRRISETPFLNEDKEQPSNRSLNAVLESEPHNDDVHSENIIRQILNHWKQKKQEKGSPKPRRITRKTTIIAFVVTVVFIISFVPHLCLQVAHLIYKGFDERLEGAALATYNTFLRSYFINSAANPVIYGVMNDKFRAEIRLLVTRLRCCK